MSMVKNKIEDNPNGWAVYSRKVRELLGRDWQSGEAAEALQCYIKPMPVAQCVEQLSAPK